MHIRITLIISKETKKKVGFIQINWYALRMKTIQKKALKHGCQTKTYRGFLRGLKIIKEKKYFMLIQTFLMIQLALKKQFGYLQVLFSVLNLMIL